MTVVNDQLRINEHNSLQDGGVELLRIEEVVDFNGYEYTHKDVIVADESDRNPGLRELYRSAGDTYERLLRSNPQVAAPEIQQDPVTGERFMDIPRGNSAAKWLYYDVLGEPAQTLEWAGKFPTAIALEPLQRLEQGGKWLQKGQLDDRSLELFTNMIDGIGLRSRARIYSQRLVEYAEESELDGISILSLGSGAAVPNIEATKKLEAKGKAAHWRFYDYDAQALMFAEALVEENDFQFSTFDYGPIWLNPVTDRLEPKGQSYVRAFSVEDESMDIVDALGLWEYLKSEDATKFASKLFEKVKPGGSMIVSNMLPSRPQREFNQRAVGWPGLYLRSDTDLLDIVTAAGIDTRQVTMTHAQDGVYVVMEIKKL